MKSEKSRLLLERLTQANGISLNIFEDMSASSIPIQVYDQAQTLVFKEATLSRLEINLIQLSVSVENGCVFCVPAHTASAIRRDNVAPDVIEAIRQSRSVSTLKIDALVTVAKSLVRHRGKLSDIEIKNFYDQGYSQEQLFEILTIVAYKTITNYTSRLMGTQPNPEHMEYVWT